MPTTSKARLTALPTELLQQIAHHLDRTSQKSLALTHSSLWDVAITSIWRNVKLLDTRSKHWPPDEVRDTWPDDGVPGRDDHDDTPIIRKLLVLASNARIAEKVRVLTHRCHLPLPAIFQDLPRVCFENHTLSSDWRTIQLCLYAVKNMTDVRVLRVLNGHHNLVAALLNGFYGPERVHVPPHLWVESCSLHGFPLRFDRPPESWENGLQSLRVRRLKLANSYNTEQRSYWLSRAGSEHNLHNGTGGTYETTVRRNGFGDHADDVFPHHGWAGRINVDFFDQLPKCVKWLNEKTFEQVPEADKWLHRKMDLAPIYGCVPSLRQQADRSEDTINVINSFNTSTLRSLNLDWILAMPPHKDSVELTQYTHFERLSKLHFPHLRAFQLRNAVTEHTLLAEHIYLLQPFTYQNPTYADLAERWAETGAWRPPKAEYFIDMLSFMERHPNLECLAWPMDRFYGAPSPGEDDRSIRDRAAAVVSNLGRTLVNLRVDFYYTARGEPQTDDDVSLMGREARVRRRLFISEFAAHMTKLTVLKLEGGIPRDEKREMMAATSRCPIEKLVMIAVSCPLGNTWGVNGDDLSAIDEGHLQFHGLLEAEPEEALIESTKEHFFPGPTHKPRVPFRAEYGWPAGPSLLHSIALHHASTITELKFCGYNGSPILHKATPITSALLHHLKHFHRLKKIVLSFWLLTFFDFDWREPEIIDYWLEQRDPSSTALVPVPPPALPPTPPPQEQQEVQSWENMVAEATGLHVPANVPAPSTTDGGSFTTALDHNDVAMEETPAADGDGDTVMAEGGQATQADQMMDGILNWNSSVHLLSALSGDDDAMLNPDAMMAAALGTGMMAYPTTDANNVTVIPITDGNSTGHSSDSSGEHNPVDTSAPLWPANPPIIDTSLPANDDRDDASSTLSDPIDDRNPWETALSERFSPLALARGVYDILGPHLSLKARKNGVQFRASFCLGVESGDIFDLDFMVDGGHGGVVESSIEGPREESETSRWWSKLEGRGWFG